MSPNIHQAPTRIAPTRDSIFVGNYGRSSQMVLITDFRDFMISLLNQQVSGLSGKIIIKWCFIYFFSPLRYASAKGRV